MDGQILEGLWRGGGNLYLFSKQMKDLKGKFKFVYFGNIWVGYSIDDGLEGLD